MPRLPHLLALVPALALGGALACGGARTAPAPSPATGAGEPVSPVATRTTAAAAPATAVPAAGDTLPFDPLVRRGTLPNGLRYYVRRNVRPENRAELRLAVNAGAVLEDEDQRGLAHFVEHMAFNGTRRFEKSEIVNFLERSGMRFGPDVNAYTGFDETVYMLTLPTDSTTIFRRGFEVLADWAGAVSFDSVEVNKERGVVVEEWRGRRGAQARVIDQQLPVIFKGSRYADRLPIGTRESLEGFPQAALRRFYEKWYRPDMMAVVAVGDFDPDTVVALIRREFAAIPAPAQPSSRPAYPVPGNDTTLFSVVADRELTSSSVSVLWKLPAREEVTAADYRRELVEELADRMLNGRLQEIAQRPDAPFLAAGAGSSGFVRASDVYQLSANVKDGAVVRGMEGILTEAERAARHGFTASELAREKADMLRDYERAYAERDRSNSASLAAEYVSAFLEKEPVPGIATEWALVQRDLPGITLDQVNAVAKSRLIDRNRVVLATVPAKEGVSVPTTRELAAAFGRVQGTQIVAWVDSAATGALVENPPAPGRITARTVHPDLGVTDWTLSNGVRVLIKPTDFQADQVVMQAFSPGGTSRAPDSLIVPAQFATTVVMTGGVGRFSQVDLQKALAGKAAFVQPFAAELSEGLTGRGSPKDLETLLQLTHLYFTQPRRDTVTWQATMQRVAQVLRNRSSSPQAVFDDTMSATLSRYHPREPLPTPALLDRMDIDRSLAFYRDRFADASDFTFVFVGNVTPEQLEPLATRWLATLPATRRRETWTDHKVMPPLGRVEKVVKAGQEPKAQTRITFHGPVATPTPEERMAFTAMREVLNIRLRETLREDKGGTYGVGVGGGISVLPAPRYALTVSFGTAPEKLEELVGEVWQHVDSLKKAPVTADELAKVKELQRRARETALRQNAWWAGRLVSALQEGQPLGAVLAEDRLIEGITPAAIQAAARKYLDTSRYVRGSLYPAGYEATTKSVP